MNPEQLRRLEGIDRLPFFENPVALKESMRSHHPPGLRDAGIGGSVLADVHIAADGTVEGVEIVERPREVRTSMILLEPDGSSRRFEPSDHPAFGPAARAALMETRFTPATRDGQPVPFTMRMTVAFDPPSGKP